MRIYISLPIETPGYDIVTQMRTARKWQRYFEHFGYEVSNPFDIYDRLCKFHKDARKPEPTREEIMREDITELICCNVIFFCNGWQNSKGCIEEAEVATQNIKIPVIFERGFMT